MLYPCYTPVVTMPGPYAIGVGPTRVLVPLGYTTMLHNLGMSSNQITNVIKSICDSKYKLLCSLTTLTILIVSYAGLFYAAHWSNRPDKTKG